MVVRTTNPKGNCGMFLLPTRGYTKRKSMAKASIHFAKASDGGLNHNDRTEKTEPEYLLPPEYRLENIFDFSAVDAAKNLRALYAAAKVNYFNNFGQKLQAKNYTWEAVVNLNKEHDLSDVKKLVLEIEKKTGFKSLQIAIHLDEGRLEKAKDGSLFPIHNRHAHITFFTLDQKNGKQLMRQDIPPKERAALREEIIKNRPELRGEKNKKMFNKAYQGLRAKRYRVFDREKLSELQDLTAKVLNMERGLKGSKSQRLEHKQYKAVKKQEEKTKDQTLAKQKDLKSEIGKLRAELKELGAVRADYAELEQVNKELKEKIKQKDLTEQELKQEINLWRDEAISQENKNLKNELEAKISPNEGQSTPKGDKNALKAVFEEINHQNEEGKPFETHKLEQDAKQTENYASAKIFKQVYETRGTKSKRTEKINWLELEVIPTVTFDIRDLEELYSELKNHDEKRTLHFQKAMNLFQRAENSLQRIFNFVKEKFISKKELSKNKVVQENDENPRRGFRR